MNDTPESILRGYVAWLGDHGNPIAAAVHSHGRLWVGSSLPARFTVGVPKGCFENAWRSVRRSTPGRLVYCEGWAISGTLGSALTMEHAWIVDAVSGCVVERTWDNNADQPNTYLGFGIPADITADALRRSKGRSVSVLFGEWARDGWFHRNHLDATAVFTAALSSSLPG